MHKMILAAGLFLSWGAAHALTVDVTRLIGVVIGGFIAALVVGDVMPPTAITRWAAVIAGCLSLPLLAAYVLREIASLHNARPHARGLANPTGAASASPRQAA